MPRHQLRLDARSPSIIVPITARDRTELEAHAEAVRDADQTFRDRTVSQRAEAAGPLFDLVEWRVDLYQPFIRGGGQDPGPAVAGLRHLIELLPEVPVLVTFRTTAEGGRTEIADQAYLDLVAALAGSGLADAVDVEYRHPLAAPAIAAAHDHSTPVVASNHDFDATPGADEIMERLASMENMGADVAKIAVMPRSAADVVTLIDATSRRFGDAGIPLITMSMGTLGAVTRVGGGVFGSAATFATVGESSAPGQLPATGVRAALHLLDLGSEPDANGNSGASQP